MPRILVVERTLGRENGSARNRPRFADTASVGSFRKKYRWGCSPSPSRPSRPEVIRVPALPGGQPLLGGSVSQNSCGPSCAERTPVGRFAAQIFASSSRS